MNGISGFLKKYLDFTPPEKATARAVAKALEEILHIPFSEKAVSVRNQEAFVSIEGVVKSEIIFRKKEILSRVNELIGGSLLDVH